MLYLKKLNFNQGIIRIELNIHEINVFGKELWLLLQDEEIISDLQFLSKWGEFGVQRELEQHIFQWKQLRLRRRDSSGHSSRASGNTVWWYIIVSGQHFGYCWGRYRLDGGVLSQKMCLNICKLINYRKFWWVKTWNLYFIHLMCMKGFFLIIGFCPSLYFNLHH